MISRVSLNWLTEPQGQGARVFACSLGTWHLERQAYRNSQEPPHPVLGQGGPCSHDRPEGPRRNIPTPAQTRTKPLPVVTERSYKGPGRIWACKKAVPSSALPVLFLSAHVG